MAIAFGPVGVDPDGVNADGVSPPGVDPPGVVPPGVVSDGVSPPGVPAGVALTGVSSHRDRRLLAPGVGVSVMISPAVRSVRGVSAQPPP